MKGKEKLLRIRPVTMANFSGGFGYVPLFAMYGFLASFPAALLLWTGLAVSLKKKNNTWKYHILKRRLNRIVLPLCLLLCVLFAGLCIWNTLSYGGSGNIPLNLIVILCVTVFPTMGIYASMFFSAFLLNKAEKLSKGKWFLCTAVFFVLLTGIGAAISSLLMSLPFYYFWQFVWMIIDAILRQMI